jgi:uncharacterized protein (DUF924 family)/Ca2+-binding EF-hand superfamily protein
MATEKIQNELIQFMFKQDSSGKLDVMGCLGLWFGKGHDTDNEIKSRFGDLVGKALKGELDAWKETPRGCLALMILVDQFPRNIYRHTVHSFDGDMAARAIAYSREDWLDVLTPEECIFVPCLIMTHQENVEDQEHGMRFYESLEPKLPTELHVFRSIFEEHLRIISLCGTFPHRDHYYGRTTSEVGRMLMENPKVRFDLPLICENGTVKFGHNPKKLWKAIQHAFDVLERIDALSNKSARRRSTEPRNYFTPEEVAEFQEVFRAFDKDGSGFFDHQELSAVLASTGRVYSKVQIQDAMDRITGIKDSTGVSFDQFSQLLRVKLNTDWETRVRQRFSLFDRDGSGEVSLEELRAGIQSLDDLVTTAEVEEMLKACDVDGNGSVSFEEFLSVAPIIMERRASQISTEPTPAFWNKSKPVQKDVVEAPPIFRTTSWDDVQTEKEMANIMISSVWDNDKTPVVRVLDADIEPMAV